MSKFIFVIMFFTLYSQLCPFVAVISSSPNSRKIAFQNQMGMTFLEQGNCGSHLAQHASHGHSMSLFVSLSFFLSLS